MRRKSLIALLTSLIGVSALFMTLASAAQANPGTDIVACVFGGSTGGNDHNGNPTASLDDIQGPVPDLVDNSGGDYPMPAPIPDLPTAGLPLLDTENGGFGGDVDGDPGGQDYQFTSSDLATDCLHLDKDGAAGVGDSSNDTGVLDAFIEASGSYNNIVCGTGDTNGTATLDFEIDPEIDSATARYFIQFVAGQGALVFTGQTMGAPNAGGSHPSLLGTGVVDIWPRPSTTNPPGGPQGCVDVDAQDFDVTGILVLVNTDDNVVGVGQALQPIIEAFLNGFKQ